MRRADWVRRVLKPMLFSAALVPALLVARDFVVGGLGADPIEALTHRTGFAAILLLVLSLTITPLVKLLHMGSLIQLRRMLGLFAFFYGLLHVLVYAVDQTYLSGFGFSGAAIVEDVLERPFITLGFVAFVLLVPLAITSTRGWVRRLGGRRWRALHRLVYAAAIAAAVHFLWAVKADVRRPAILAGILTVLLGVRLVAWWAARDRAPVLQSAADTSSGSITPM